MKPNEREEFLDLLQGVMDFYKESLGEFAIQVWTEAMRPYDMSAIRSAFSRHARNPDNGQYAPKPADIERILGGRSIDAAQVAWSKVDRAMRTVGPYQSVAFDDPAIHAVLSDMGGWTLLAAKTDKEWPFVANEFVQRYRGYVIQGEVPIHAPKMVGLVEAHNAAIGAAPPEPALIGNRERAAAVRDGGTQRLLEGA